MSKDEIKKLLCQIKVFYPRFDTVDKVEGRYRISEAAIESWFSRIGFMDFEKAVQILDSHMAGESGNKTPGINLWIAGGKQLRSSRECTAFLDRKHGCIVWTPEENAKPIERRCSFDSATGCWEDEDGYRWVTQEEAGR